MINKLIANIKKTGAPIVVGLDPMLNYIPKQIQEAAFKEFGETLEGAAEAIWQYNKGIVDATHDLIPAVKPQIAMYEQFGIPGLMAYKRTVDYCKEKEIEYYRNFKSRQTIKLLGETLERHCEVEFNKLRAMGFPHAYFEKDNDIKTGSKGDYIFRDYDENGDEVVSIMFEMKNENDTTANKKKNKDFFKELDKDRREKSVNMLFW